MESQGGSQIAVIQAPEPSTIQPDGSGGFQVVGSHTFSRLGLHTVRVTIQDAGGRSTTTTGMVRVTA